VVHDHHRVEVPGPRAQEDRVGRQRSLDVQALPADLLNGRADDGDFLDYCDSLNLDATLEPVRG
jgi:hypothetical protein